MKKQSKHFSKDEMKEMSDYLKNNIPIIDIAVDLGFTPVRRGQKYFSLKEHDSVMIDTEKNCFWRNADNTKGASGSVIDFLIYFGSENVTGAYKILYEKAGGQNDLYNRLFHYNEAIAETQNSRTIQEKAQVFSKSKGSTPELVLPKPDITMKNVFAYLTKTRGVPSAIVQEFVDHKMLYQDQLKNCVFLSYDGKKPVYGCKRGTNTYRKFVGDCAGNDYIHGFTFCNPGANKLYIAESVIDGMSRMAMFMQNGVDYHEYNWHFLAGTQKTESLLQYLDQDIKDITIGVDNDKSGHACAEEIEKLFLSKDKKVQIEFPKKKDWNLDLLDTNLNPIKKKYTNPIKTYQNCNLEEKKALEMR